MKKVIKMGCLGMLGVIVLFGMLAALAGNRNQSSSTNVAQAPIGAADQEAVPAAEPQATDLPEATAAPTAAPEAFTIGQDVQVDEVRWKILEAQDLGQTLKSDNQFIKDKTTTGRFIQVRFELENLSKDMLSFAGIDLQDADGRTFKPSSDAFGFIAETEHCVFENLNPNVAKTCTAIYEVPTNAADLHAIVGDLKLFGSKTARISLSL